MRHSGFVMSNGFDMMIGLRARAKPWRECPYGVANNWLKL
jgi:hypothetical protein